MVTCVIFWSAVFCIMFFLLGAVCKCLVAIFHAFLSTLELTLGCLIVMGMTMLAIVIVYEIIVGIIAEGIMSVLGYLVMLIIEIAIIGLLIGWLGKIILSIVALITDAICHLVATILEGMAGTFEKVYVYFLEVILKRIDRC